MLEPASTTPGRQLLEDTTKRLGATRRYSQLASPRPSTKLPEHGNLLERQTEWYAVVGFMEKCLKASRLFLLSSSSRTRVLDRPSVPNGYAYYLLAGGEDRGDAQGHGASPERRSARPLLPPAPAQELLLCPPVRTRARGDRTAARGEPQFRFLFRRKCVLHAESAGGGAPRVRRGFRAMRGALYLRAATRVARISTRQHAPGCAEASDTRREPSAARHVSRIQGWRRRS